MSQGEVYKIIQELGGEATTCEIKKRAKEKFHEFSLWQYVVDRLKKLEKNQYVVKDIDLNGKIVWKIITSYP